MLSEIVHERVIAARRRTAALHLDTRKVSFSTTPQNTIITVPRHYDLVSDPSVEQVGRNYFCMGCPVERGNVSKVVVDG